jgi:hypothetical protein
VNLAAFQRAVVALSFASSTHPDPALAPFALYRHMIRARLYAMAEVAYRRSWALLGEASCSASFARFLAQTPPQSPIIREVIRAFAAFAERDDVLFYGAPPESRDLLRFEAAKWRVASAPDALGSTALREVDFDGVLVVNPTLERLALEHVVDDETAAGVRQAHTLLVYRRRDDDDVRWYRAPALLADLLALAAEPNHGQATLGALVAELFLRLRPAPEQTEELLTNLSGSLAVAVERSVLWGVYDPSSG